MRSVLDPTPSRRPRPFVDVRRGRRLPTVSVIIPAYDEEAVIERCVLAVASQTLPPHEILVVDNRSTDRTAALVHRLTAAHPWSRIRLIEQHAVQGLIPTRNAGFAAATGEVLGRIDADTVVAADWVQQVAEAMCDPRIAAVTGPVRYYDVGPGGVRRVSDHLVRRALHGLGTEYPFLYGSNMALRATAWRTIEPVACLDPEDLLHEDIDLAIHLYQAGLRAAYVPTMRVGVSARRVDTSPRAYRAYTRRFERTYDQHAVSHWHLKVPQLVLRGVYWPARIGRTLYTVRPVPTRLGGRAGHGQARRAG
jgi:cellulose synthase/poly-beta-1,6-N-acetylglucosamine synthase-like glycosyltransferase